MRAFSGVVLFAVAIGGVGLGALMVWAIVALSTRHRTKARLARWESRLHGLESELSTARLERAELLEKGRGHSRDVSALNQTISALRAEAEELRAGAADANYARDLARRRADNAMADLDYAHGQSAELAAAARQLATRDRELQLATEQRLAVGPKLEEALRAKQAAEAEQTRIALLVETLEQQLRQAAGVAKQERARFDASRAHLTTQLRERQHELDETRRQADRLQRERGELDREVARLTQLRGDAEATSRVAGLAHQEEMARLAAEIGAHTAQLDRLEPLRRQVADREVLVRSLATERDAAAELLASREAELRDASARLDAALVEQRRLSAAAETREATVADLERRLAAAIRERDALTTAERQGRARIEGLTAELKDRDVRFRALLEDRRATVEASEGQLVRLRAQLAQGAPPDPEPTNGGPRDDLKRIAGIGPTIERLLEQEGVRTFRQIASWSEADIERISERLGAFRTRIRRDRWIEQARLEHEKQYGERLDR